MASDLDPQLCLTIYPARGMKSDVRSKGKGEGCGSRPVLRAGNSIHLGECVICGGIIHNFLLRRVLRPAKLIAKKKRGVVVKRSLLRGSTRWERRDPTEEVWSHPERGTTTSVVVCYVLRGHRARDVQRTPGREECSDTQSRPSCRVSAAGELHSIEMEMQIDRRRRSLKG